MSGSKNKSGGSSTDIGMREYSFNMAPQFDRERTLSPIQSRIHLINRSRDSINSTPEIREQTPKLIQSSRHSLSQLSTSYEEMVLRAVSFIRKEDSHDVLETLDSTRDILRDSFEEFKREQELYRTELERIMKMKEAAIQRPKENLIPLSVLLRKKQDFHTSADRQPDSTMNPTYQVYFEALLTQGCNSEQDPTDRAAVAKYIRRRERRKRAEENKQNHTISNDTLEKRTAELIQNMEGVDLRLEHERQRNNEIIRSRMNEKKTKTNNILQATEIIDQASEADLIRQRVEQAQREKVEARLSAIRHQNSRPASNIIHVQPLADPEEDIVEDIPNEGDQKTTKETIEILNEQSGYGSRPGTAQRFTDQVRVTNIEI